MPMLDQKADTVRKRYTKRDTRPIISTDRPAWEVLPGTVAD